MAFNIVNRNVKDMDADVLVIPTNEMKSSDIKATSKLIVEVMCPVWQQGGSGELDELYKCYFLAFRQAAMNKCTSIAFPLIGAKEEGFPKDIALQVALDVIRRALYELEMDVYLAIDNIDNLELPEYILTAKESSIQWKERIGFKYTISAYNSRANDYKNMWDWVRYEERATSSIPYDDPSKKRLEDILAERHDTFQQRLLYHIDRRQISEVDVYKKANIDRKLFSKIRCNEKYKPSKKTILVLAIALELGIKETLDLLARAEHTFSPCNRFDAVVKYYIEKEMYDVYAINIALFKYNLPMLGE